MSPDITSCQKLLSKLPRALHLACRTYANVSELKADYKAGKLHPVDLKDGLKNSLNAILEPVRKHFETDATAHDLLEKVKQCRMTR